MLRTLLLTTAGALLLAGPATAATLTSSTTTPFDGAGAAGGLRLRALTNNAGQARAFGGYADLGVAANQKANIASNALTWGASQTFSINYNAGTDVFSFSVGNQNRSFNGFDAGLPAAFNAKPLNAFTIRVRDGSANGTISLTNLLVNGTSYSDIVSTDGTTFHSLRSAAFGGSFSASGTLGLAGLSGGAESNAVELLVGNAVPEPATWAMMIGGFGLVGASMRRRAPARSVLA